MCFQRVLSVCLTVLLAFSPCAFAQETTAYENAVSLFHEGEYAQAKELFESDPDAENARLYLLWIDGYDCIDSENFDDALTIYEALAGRSFLNSKDMASYVRARLLEREGEIDAALELYTALDVLDSVTRQVALTRQIKNATPAPTIAPTPIPTLAPANVAGKNEAVATVNGVVRHMELSGNFVLYTALEDTSILHLYFNTDGRQLSLSIPVDIKAGDVIDQNSGRNRRGWLYKIEMNDHNYEPFKSYSAGNSIHEPYDPDPIGSSYTIALTSISADGRTYRGTFSGTLLNEDGSELVVLTDGVFACDLKDQTLSDVRNGRPQTSGSTERRNPIAGVKRIPTTPRPTPKATPAVTYSFLGIGSEGWEVTRLQNRLIALGYLRDRADGDYGKRTEQAVTDFQSANGLTDTGYADSDTQALLFSSRAIKYTEPHVALVIKRPTSWGNWKKLKNNYMQFRMEVENVSTWRTIKSFELYCYPVNRYGYRILGKDMSYIVTTKVKLAPGESAKCAYFTLANRSEIAQIYCGVHKVTYSDGTVATNSDVSYGIWDIVWD